MHIVKVFWGLDASLAYARHFPAINWLTSYSLYIDNLAQWFDDGLGKSFRENRTRALGILQEEAGLQEIVRLVGVDSLSAEDRLTLETAKMIREDFLQQNAFVDVDSYSTYDRQARLLALILQYDKFCRAAIAEGASLERLFRIGAKDQIGRAKAVAEDRYVVAYGEITQTMEAEIKEAVRESLEEDV